MKQTWIPLGILALLVIASFAISANIRPKAQKVLNNMEQAAVDLLASLDDKQQKQIHYPFDDKERMNWHFFPQDRAGVPLRAMSDTQQEKAKALLRSGLSDQGLTKTKAIMQLERVLQIMEKLPVENDRRHPELYYFTLFGDPTQNDPWGWRIEGHHISLNYSSIDGELAVTPAFWGSNPAEVRETQYSGTHVLDEEEHLGRELIKMLTPEQQDKAIFLDEAPPELLTFVDKKLELDAFEGISYKEFTQEQKDLFIRLIKAYTHNMKKAVHEKHWEKIKADGLDKLFFAWAGGQEKADPHYYRIHGPSLFIEYDNTQNDANHLHTVYRDPTNDFGEDLLHQHYHAEGSHHSH